VYVKRKKKRICSIDIKMPDQKIYKYLKRLFSRKGSKILP
jgi:hypothetical protein